MIYPMKAQIRATMTTENNLRKMKEENKAIRSRMETAEEKANKLEASIQDIQQMVIQNKNQLKGQMQELEVSNLGEAIPGYAQMVENWKQSYRVPKNMKEMDNLKELLLKIRGINLDQMKSADVPWTYLLKCKIVGNPQGNRWAQAPFTETIISAKGLKATKKNRSVIEWQSVKAEKGFIISAHPSGPLLYYFEVTIMLSHFWPIHVGLSSGNIPTGTCVGELPNSYAIRNVRHDCLLSGETHYFQSPNGAIKPEWGYKEDVYGCGLVLNAKNELSLFFTGNGILMGKQIPINSTANPLYPTVSMRCGYGDVSVEANFGDDLAKPFRYDIDKFGKNQALIGEIAFDALDIPNKITNSF